MNSKMLCLQTEVRLTSHERRRGRAHTRVRTLLQLSATLDQRAVRGGGEEEVLLLQGEGRWKGGMGWE